MLESMVCDVWQRGDTLLGFYGKFVHVIKKVM
jgi:hypothetical protein